MSRPPRWRVFRNAAGHFCSSFVQELFDHVDDALFELADRTAINAEQNMYFESMREVRIKRRGIEQALVRDMGEGFRCLGARYRF